jgi:signal transduction histidine kinase
MRRTVRTAVPAGVGPGPETGLHPWSESKVVAWVDVRRPDEFVRFAAMTTSSGRIADAPWVAPVTAVVAAVLVLVVGLQRDVFTEPGAETVLVLAAGLPWFVDACTRHFPRTLWVIVVVGATTYLYGWRPVTLDFSPFFLVYVVGTMATVLPTRASAAVAVLAAGPGIVLDLSGRTTGSLIWVFGITMAWFFGFGFRQQLVLLAELESAQSTVAEAAAASERQRLARELHDLIAHTLAVTMLHLTGARLALDDGDTAEARSGLEQAERTGREAMAELRRTVGLLGPGPPGEGPVAPPAPTARDVPLLIDGFRAAGLEVRAVVRGDLDRVPDGPGLAVYRVVQESLTNAAKHGAESSVPVAVEVSVDDAGDAVRVRVTNPMPATAGDDGGEGYGVRGMHERVALLHGGLRAGRHGERWVVDAEIPIR